MRHRASMAPQSVEMAPQSVKMAPNGLKMASKWRHNHDLGYISDTNEEERIPKKYINKIYLFVHLIYNKSYVLM